MRILVVEDEHKIANSIKRGLEQELFAVDVAYDGLRGYDLASTEGYDLIILDRLIPGIDGLEICKKLRADYNHVPILFLTAKGAVDNRVLGLNAGADDYLVKPFAFEELLARIRALIRRPKSTLKAVLKVNDLSLDTLTYEVNRSSQRIHLSSREFSLLEFLMRHMNKIVTKKQIIDHVWDYDADILPNTVEVFIKLLRNKIDKPFKNKRNLIHTIRGFGYKIGRK